MSITVTVAVPIAAVSTVVRIPVSISTITVSTIAVSSMAVTTVASIATVTTVASIASVTSIPIIAIVGPLNGSGQQASQQNEGNHDDLIECEAGDNSVDSPC